MIFLTQIADAVLEPAVVIAARKIKIYLQENARDVPELSAADNGMLLTICQAVVAIIGILAVWAIFAHERKMLRDSGSAFRDSFPVVKGWERGEGSDARFASILVVTVLVYFLTPFLVVSLLGKFGQIGSNNGVLMLAASSLAVPLVGGGVLILLLKTVTPKFRFQTAVWREVWRKGPWLPVTVALAAVTLTSVVSQAQIYFDRCYERLTGKSLGFEEMQGIIESISMYREKTWFLVLIAFSVVVLAPIVEELFFRGFIYPFFKDRLGGAISAAVVTAIFFGAVHGNLGAFLPLAIFSLLLCWIYERTGDIRASIATHAVFNLYSLILVFFFGP